MINEKAKLMENFVKYGSLALLLLAACTREKSVDTETTVELTATYSPDTRTS